MICRRAADKINPKNKVRISPKGPKWAADDSSDCCKGCGFVFSVVIRRHHCRMCGQLFCRYCCGEKWPIAKFEYLAPVRVCRKCARLCWKSEALAAAIHNNDVGALSRYVERKNDCNLHIGVFPPLTVAASGGFARICQLLVDGGAKVNHSVPNYTSSTLVQCSFCLKLSAFEQKRNRTDFECPSCHEVTNFDTAEKVVGDHVGVTALHASVQVRGHAGVVEVLLAEGAEVDARTGRGNTPLMLCAKGGHKDCADLLLAHGADVNAVGGLEGDTPLHLAVKEGHAAMVRLLVQHGARLDIRNSQGMTAAMLADKSKKADVVQALSGV